MPLFSQRKGLKPLQKAIRRESLDEETRNKLWSGITLVIFDKYDHPNIYGHQNTSNNKIIDQLFWEIWLNIFSLPVDTIPEFKKAYLKTREHFFKSEWNDALDFLEFIVNNVPNYWSEKLVEVSNKYFTIESSVYRFVGKEIIEITDENEIMTTEEALNNDAPYTKHLSRSLELLSDRKTPDYRNSIKESISAVEAMCRIITKNDKAVLSDCLKEIKKKHSLHPAFEQALIKLYSYTSDEGGIRHSFTDKSVDISYSDAKFMFILCCSFINYLNGKLSE